MTPDEVRTSHALPVDFIRFSILAQALHIFQQPEAEKRLGEGRSFCPDNCDLGARS